MAMRCQAMSSGPRSVRSDTMRPLTPAVPQQTAARTTSGKPRDAAEVVEGVGMTLLGGSGSGEGGPEHGAEPRQLVPGSGQPAVLRVRSAAGAARGRAVASWGRG